MELYPFSIFTKITCCHGLIRGKISRNGGKACTTDIKCQWRLSLGVVERRMARYRRRFWSLPLRGDVHHPEHSAADTELLRPPGSNYAQAPRPVARTVCLQHMARSIRVKEPAAVTEFSAQIEGGTTFYCSDKQPEWRDAVEKAVRVRPRIAHRFSMYCSHPPSYLHSHVHAKPALEQLHPVQSNPARFVGSFLSNPYAFSFSFKTQKSRNGLIHNLWYGSYGEFASFSPYKHCGSVLINTCGICANCGDLRFFFFVCKTRKSRNTFQNKGNCINVVI